MGTLRTLLAIAVVFAHTPLAIRIFGGGRVAVQMFYAISGFLITYVLENVKAYQNPRRFYENRALRIFPVYWAVLAMSALVAFVFSTQMASFRQLPVSAQTLLVTSHLILFGQDWVMFTSVAHGHLSFCANFSTCEVQFWRYLLVPQAWTLGVELTFYLLAPFIVRRMKLMVALFCCAWLARGVGALAGLVYDPWNYRFFPFELGIFLLGALSYKLYAHYRLKTLCSRRETQWVAYGVTILILAVASHPRLHGSLVTAAILTWTFVALPFLFHFQQVHRLDGVLGELSYPVYIGHYLVIQLLQYGRGWGISHLGTLFSSDLVYSLIALVFSVALAVVLKMAIADPMEKLRKSVRVQTSRVPQSEPATIVFAGMKPAA